MLRSFHNYVYREISDIAHMSLGGKLKLLAFCVMLFLVYFGTILVVASMQQLAYNHEFESNNTGRVAGEQDIHSRFYVMRGE